MVPVDVIVAGVVATEFEQFGAGFEVNSTPIRLWEVVCVECSPGAETVMATGAEVESPCPIRPGILCINFSGSWYWLLLEKSRSSVSNVHEPVSLIWFIGLSR